MIRITLVDIEVSTHEKLAELMMKYGKLGYAYAYRHEDFDVNEMFLTDSPIEFDNYHEEMVNVGEISKQLDKERGSVYILPNGSQLLILGKGQI